MKNPLIFLLLFCVFAFPLTGLSEQAALPALYTGQVRSDVKVYAQPDAASAGLGYVSKNKQVEILEVEPDWLKIRSNGTLEGYIRRHTMIDTSVKAVNPKATPQYSTMVCDWLAWVSEEAPVLAEPSGSAEVLITMKEGARLALIDIQDGWGRMIYHRQYAYINTNHLREILPVNKAESAGSEAPVAAYTSFYKITTDDSNLNRMVNLQVACSRFELYTLAKGDILDFNRHIGPYSRKVGYLPANALVRGETVQSYGGGTCQVSSTLYNTVLQMPGIAILKRRAHGPSAASYLPHGADAAVGSITQNFIIQNHYAFPIRIDGSVQDGALTIAIYRAD